VSDGSEAGRGEVVRRLSAQQVAALTNGELVGSADVTVSRVAPLDHAGPGDLSFLASKRYLPYFQRSRAAIVLCRADLVQGESGGPACRVLVRDPHIALLSVIPVLYPEPAWEPGVHRTAVIGPGTLWQERVAIGPYAVLGRGVRLGRNARVGAGCVLGDGVEVGDDVQLYPQVVCYSGTIIGHRVILHAGARLGSDGFGYVPGGSGELPRKIPQVGRCIIGDDVEIGANTTIDRATVGSTIVRRGAKIDNLVMIAHGCEVGEQSMLAAQVGLSGSTRVGRLVRMGGQAGAAGHLTIGDGAQVAAQSGVANSVAAGATVGGTPSRRSTSGRARGRMNCRT